MSKLLFKVETRRLLEAVKPLEVVDKKATLVIQFSLKPVKTVDGDTSKFLLANMTACDGKVKIQSKFAYLAPKKEANMTAYKNEANEKGIVKTVIVETGRFITNVTGLSQMGSVIELEVNGVLTMKCGQSLLHLPVLEKVSSDFKVETAYKIAVRYETKRLKTAVNRVQIASAALGSAERPMLENLTFVVTAEGDTRIYGGCRFWATAQTAATDVKVSDEVEEKPSVDYNFAVPAAIVKSILNVTASEYVYIFIMNKQVSLKCGNATFSCQLSTDSLYAISSRLENWLTFNDANVICDRGELMDALRLVKAASDCDKVTISQEDGFLKIEAAGNIASVDATWSGAFEALPTNAAQILKYLQVCNTEMVGIFSSVDEKTPLRVQEVIVGGDDGDSDGEEDFTVAAAAAYIMRYADDEESEESSDDEESEE